MLKAKKDDTLGKLLDRAAAEVTKNEAMVQGNSRIKYDTYLDKVKCMANDLLKLGVKKGDKITIWMANNPKGRDPRAMPAGEFVFAQRASSEA